jgi:hypothetical protein
MARRRKGDALCPSRAWVWTADAERRWLRAFRLLLTPDEPAQGVVSEVRLCRRLARGVGVRKRASPFVRRRPNRP